MRHNLLLSTAVLAASLASAAHAQGIPACFEQNIGAPLGLGDDAVAVGLPLQFPFPITGLTGVTTQAIDVSSNGAVYLESGIEASSRCCNGSAATFLSSTANIAVMWHDLNPTAGGAVHFNATAAKATVTWVGVPEFGSTDTNTCQLQLFPDGSFELLYAETSAPATHTGLVGYTPGNGAVDPGSTDISSAVPFQSNSEPTIYEIFGAGSGDYSFANYLFTPNGAGGWAVLPGNCASVRSVGRGCPTPAAFYELFGVGGNDLSGNSIQLSLTTNGNGYAVLPAGPGNFLQGFTNNLGVGDDTLVPAQPLGFSIPIPGAGLVSDIDISSNGWAAPAGLFTGSDFSEDVGQLLTEGTRFAVCWDDFNPNSGGGVYFDIINGVAVVTWDQVPQFANSDSNTFQLQIRPDATIVMCWESVLDDSLVGFSEGNGVPDPGATDISNDLPIVLTGGSPLTHSADVPPALGSTVNWTVDGVPANAALVAINFGLVNPNLPLDAIGADGCTLLASTEASIGLPPPTNGTSALALTIPNNTALVGATLFTQGIVAGSTANSLGIIASNGLANTFGL